MVKCTLVTSWSLLYCLSVWRPGNPKWALCIAVPHYICNSIPLDNPKTKLHTALLYITLYFHATGPNHYNTWYRSVKSLLGNKNVFFCFQSCLNFRCVQRILLHQIWRHYTVPSLVIPLLCGFLESDLSIVFIQV